MKGYTNLAKLLRKKGANPDIPDKSRETTLHLAAFDGHANVAKLLVKQGADIAAIDAVENKYTDVAKLLRNRSADVATADSYGLTPLKAVSRKGYTEVVKLLLENAVDSNIFDTHCGTLAPSTTHDRHVDVAKALVRKGAGVADVDHYGLKPLHDIFERASRVVLLLLKTGAYTKAKGASGRGSLFLPFAKGHLGVIEQLFSIKGVNRRQSLRLHGMGMRKLRRVCLALKVLTWTSMIPSVGVNTKSGNTYIAQAMLKFARGRDIQVDDGDLGVEPSLIDTDGSTRWCGFLTEHLRALEVNNHGW
ncbi:ankyrin repeat-containing domain protein [Emericellopsis atlantica]|uniref:Ankyrin repeat-containing domain protein n=1 Tax=Emericellopsis atlantica TaxID=2614577 RepID=A0A9P8CK50_9HYPO|nr:ankyrin repeat-containing domain protein [Emericellopsis atlantica]KAG9249687.1 ankyrin repeat-containing domain protein [Emericellopsis atlantica]